MFESVCLSLVEQGTNDTPAQVRAKVAKENADDQEQYMEFFSSSINNEHGDNHLDLEDHKDLTFEDYFIRMAKDEQWGGNMELQAVKEVYRSEIKVCAA